MDASLIVIQISKLGRVKVHVYIIWLRFRFVWPLVKVNLKDIIFMYLNDVARLLP